MTPINVLPVIVIWILTKKTYVNAHSITNLNFTPFGRNQVKTLMPPPRVWKPCKWEDCSPLPDDVITTRRENTAITSAKRLLRQILLDQEFINAKKAYQPNHRLYLIEKFVNKLPNLLSMFNNTNKQNLISKGIYSASNKYTRRKYKMTPSVIMKEGFIIKKPLQNKEQNTATTEKTEERATPAAVEYNKNETFKRFVKSFDKFQRKFYMATFTKLSSISPVERQENGISFVQSSLFLYMLLAALSVEMDPETSRQIEECIGFSSSDAEKIQSIQQVVSTLPVSNDELKFRWSTRLVLAAGVSQKFSSAATSALRIQVDRLNGTESPAELVMKLNEMVETDSANAMHDTFEEDEVSHGVRAVLLSTMYLRGRWRASPTLLNGTRPFRDATPLDADAPQRAARMIRINDDMRYADLTEWDAEAVEISYATPGLSLLLVVPRGASLRALAARVGGADLRSVTGLMRPIRMAATLPLFTLRMTLLLPSKLQAMGISRLVDAGNGTSSQVLRLSHAVQRLMFWAEAGRNAFKDDGIEWDKRPELEMLVDRPYIFFVRWRNVTLMNGNFVL